MLGAVYLHCTLLDCAVVLPGCTFVYTTLANTYSYTSWPSKIGAMMTKCLYGKVYQFIELVVRVDSISFHKIRASDLVPQLNPPRD